MSAAFSDCPKGKALRGEVATCCMHFDKIINVLQSDRCEHDMHVSGGDDGGGRARRRRRRRIGRG